MNMEFQGKNVLIVDGMNAIVEMVEFGLLIVSISDSIVRGTTSYEIIQMAREAGARKVYFASCAPPIR